MGFITNRIKVYKARIIIIIILNVYKVNPKIETFGVCNLLLSETLIRSIKYGPKAFHLNLVLSRGKISRVKR